MEHDERIPGVTFRLTRADKKPPIDPKKHKAIGYVELTAEINDFMVWEDVLQRLNGMRVYTVENLAEEMISVAQNRAREAERDLEVKNQALQAELEKAKQNLSFTKAELQQRLQTVMQQGKELHRLRAIEQELKELEEEAKGLAFERDLGD